MLASLYTLKHSCQNFVNIKLYIIRISTIVPRSLNSDRSWPSSLGRFRRGEPAHICVLSLAGDQFGAAIITAHSVDKGL
jgi:hypothetical protein